MRKNSFILSFIIMLLVVPQIKGQNVPLGYNDFIKNILQYNPLSKQAENIKKYGELNYKAARGNYDPLLSGSFNQKQFNDKNYFTTLNSEIKQPIFTSQYLKAGYDYGLGTNINPEQSTASNGLPYLGLEVGVLQGLVIDKRRAEVLKSKEYVNYYDAEKQIQLNGLLYESSQAYFNWLFTSKQIALNNYFMVAAKQRLDAIEVLANIGEKAPVDTIEAAIFYQTRLLDLQSAQIDNQKNTYNLSSYNWLDNATTTTLYQYTPIDSLDAYFIKAKSKLMELMQLDGTLNPILTKYNSLQKVLEIENRLKKEMIKPVLNVKYNFLSNNPNSLTPAISNNSYKWGLDLSFPLLFRNSTNEYKMAKLISQNNGLELLNKSNELSFKTNALKQTISILATQLDNTARSVNYSIQLLEAEKLKFFNGESSLFLLNTRENKLLESELKLAEYKLKFIKTVLNIIYLNGNLNYNL